MIKSISFIVSTQFFHFNELKFLRQPGYLIFLVKPTIFLDTQLYTLIVTCIWKWYFSMCVEYEWIQETRLWFEWKIAHNWKAWNDTL